MSNTTVFISFLALLGTAVSIGLPPIYFITPAQWAAFNSSVGGRLRAGTPIGLPCYQMYYNGAYVKKTQIGAACNQIQASVASSTFIADNFGGYQNTNWGACQANSQSCYLSGAISSNGTNGTCDQGSVPNYYVEVYQVSDVQKTMLFAQVHGITLVVKNSGHDYKGRSSAPHSLALWTHSYRPELLINRNFTPEGCARQTLSVITMGAGQGFGPLYDFAHENNVHVVGGTSETVGAAGGWITGGGHSALSNTLGLGVDNVQQIRAILPNGSYITANRCKNTDIFFALRGGGGGTFGVIMEMSTLAHPVQSLQLAQFTFASLSSNQTRQFISTIVQNANKWASEGWGGYTLPGISGSISEFGLLTPKLTLSEAQASMKPLSNFAIGKNITTLINNVSTIPSFWDYFRGSGGGLPATQQGTALSSRLVPSKNFEPENQVATTDALSRIVETSGSDLPLFICITAPSTYKVPEDDQPDGPGASAVTPAWRTSPWHVIHTRSWDPTVGGRNSVNYQFAAAHKAMNHLRELTPDGGAYLNEADTFETDPAGTFWGETNYKRLIALKRKIDPKNILTTHQAIGWDKNDPRYACYPDDPNEL